MTRAEVIVVDAGFSGVTAARILAEARHRGQCTVTRVRAVSW
jgi:monoamine oxidase